MKTSALLLLVLTTLTLGACASNKECGGNTSYRHADTVPPIVGSGGLTVPDSPAALRIPPVSAEEKAQAVPKASNSRTACLDFPPDISPAAAAK